MGAARIMIVEDNTTVAEDCRECLESYGFSVTSIRASGEEAVANAAKEGPDAVLMDIKLRGDMDGIEAAAKIYTHFDIPVVFLSAYSDRDLLQRAKQTGSFGYLVKPFDERELFTMLEMTLYKVNAENERRRMEARLEEARKMEAVGRLAGGVAHELNNMLAIIIGYTQSVMEEVDPAGTVRGDLLEVLSAAERSAGLVNRLLTFARKQIINPEVLDLNREVEKRMGGLRRMIGESIELAWHPAEDLWPVKIDPSQIDQILTILCSNAGDAIGGSGKITLETGMMTFDSTDCAEHDGVLPGNFVLLAVGDNGCGMDRETLANLFEPFFTTKEFGQAAGLGLATLYGIVKQNSGFVHVLSEPGKGSTLKIYLPRHIPGSEEGP